MLQGVAELAYDGSMHPGRPNDKGAPPVQHVLNILTARLAWQTERREETARDVDDEPGQQKTTGLERHNQIIAALGTAIAALARVNDLSTIGNLSLKFLAFALAAPAPQWWCDADVSRNGGQSRPPPVQ